MKEQLLTIGESLKERLVQMNRLFMIIRNLEIKSIKQLKH